MGCHKDLRYVESLEQFHLGIEEMEREREKEGERERERRMRREIDGGERGSKRDKNILMMLIFI